MINNDEECIEFYNLNLKGKGLKIISLNKKCPDFLTYIRNRFNDIDGTETVKELIYRIENKLEEVPKCPVCGKHLTFYKRNWKYKSFCSNICKNSEEGKKIIQLKSIKTNIEKYGCNVSSLSEKVKEKMKQTCLKKYGAECSLKNKNIKNKAIETWLLNYGVDNPNKSDNIKEKKKQTCLGKYGVNNPFELKEIRDKAKETCLEKYGFEYAMQNNFIKLKYKETCLEKYGMEYVTQTDIFKEKSRKICLEKYGVEYIFLVNDFREKSKKTCLEKYGVSHPMKSDIVKNKVMHTCLLHYGVEHPTQNNEIMLKAFNNRLITCRKTIFSKKENEIYEYLITLDNDIKRQYYSDLYPFHCDFYLPKYDLYIEYQGMWTHGKHPFDKNNKDDIELLYIWKVKSENSKFYKAAIKNWTVTDPLKRKVAQENNLNYLEIFPGDTYKDMINNYLKI